MSMLVFAIAALFVYGGTNFYVGKKLYQYIGFFFPKIHGIAFAVFFIVLAATFIVSMMLLPSVVKTISRAISVCRTQ